ncbi:hypothetical protein GA0070609_4038 [Micromonospora echinaurantiaca]|uniref:WD40-like Beta Propeller Repeat n=1 Tax=Micromonospora echinaurantiaca TaxID=47857 RepID=A0A1C5J402_9ACTN|nr:hypothetical protein GA0070609_4038 [Micromonospora echinaurantiaca]
MESTAPEPAHVTPPEPHRLRGWLAVALAGVLIGGAAGVTVWRTSATRSPAPAEVVTPVTAQELLAGLPGRLLPPANPTALPTDRAVGRGALLYQIDDTNGFDAAAGAFPERPMYLVTASGEQFGVGMAPTVGESRHMLSPDGRWLVQRRDGQWRLRDLTGITERAVPPGYALRQWSTDGQALLLSQPSGAVEMYTAFTLPGGELRPLALRGTPNRRMLPFLDGREIVSAEFNLGPNARPHQQLTIAIHDADGRTARAVSLPTTQEVSPGDIRNALAPLVRGGGNPPAVWALVIGQEGKVLTGQPEGTRATTPNTLVGVDLRSGRPAGRIELVTSRGDEGEYFLGLAGTEVLLQRWTADGSELVAVDPATARRRVLTSLPELARLTVPGE